MAPDSDDRVASTLAEIRGRGYRNGATGAACARLSDAAAVDIPVLLAAVEAVLKLADEWEADSFIVDPEIALRAAITTALTGEETADAG